MRAFRFCVLIAVASAALSTSSRAGLLELISSGTEAAGAKVGTTTLSSNAAFSVTAIFDTTTRTSASSAFAYTISSLTITVTGVGTFTAAASDFVGPTAQVTVFLEDPSTIGSYGGGFENYNDTNGYVANYSMSSAAFSAAAPSPTTFSVQTGSAVASSDITLANGAGFFSLGDIVTNLATNPISTSILVPTTVPEPSSLVLLGSGVAALNLAARRRRRLAGA